LINELLNLSIPFLNLIFLRVCQELLHISGLVIVQQTS
jgi:hypothetical protein